MAAIRSAHSADHHDPAHIRSMADFAGARLFVYARSLGTVLRVDGEIDASNARQLTETIRGFAGLKTPLVLDLSHLGFVSVEGFRALLFLNDELRKVRVHCSVVTGAALRPLVRIVRDNGLVIVDSVAEAFQNIDDIVRARRQFLSELARPRQPALTHAGRSAAS
jgi:anti-sigma B factor antagonist